MDIKNIIGYYAALNKEEINLFLKKINNYSDPINLILSDTGKWLLSNPNLNKEKVYAVLKKEIEKKINSESKICYITGEEELFFYSISDELLLSWNILTNSVNIPFKDHIEKLNNENSILKKEIKELITEFREAKLILENKNDALLNNGFYSLYFKYIFARKKYIKEGEKVLEDIKKEIDIKKEKIKENNIEIRKSPEILNKVLEKLSEISSFPI